MEELSTYELKEKVKQKAWETIGSAIGSLLKAGEDPLRIMITLGPIVYNTVLAKKEGDLQ